MKETFRCGNHHISGRQTSTSEVSVLSVPAQVLLAAVRRVQVVQVGRHVALRSHGGGRRRQPDNREAKVCKALRLASDMLPPILPVRLPVEGLAKKQPQWTMEMSQMQTRSLRNGAVGA